MSPNVKFSKAPRPCAGKANERRVSAPADVQSPILSDSSQSMNLTLIGDRKGESLSAGDETGHWPCPQDANSDSPPISIGRTEAVAGASFHHHVGVTSRAADCCMRVGFVIATGMMQHTRTPVIKPLKTPTAPAPKR